MHLNKFERDLNELRARNGWAIDIECRGVYLITIRDKETDKPLYRTWATSLEALLKCTDEKSLNSGIWEKL